MGIVSKMAAVFLRWPPFLYIKPSLLIKTPYNELISDYASNSIFSKYRKAPNVTLLFANSL